ncbi:YciI family protein [Hamadaea tsunoensis]|uniref:YciI family protein n=1 Tax=Hamadaea tsunoensis TaxID=53368 RepID=UPI000409B00B|nr:YciI family protein [Hamadaea tsunoensis]
MKYMILTYGSQSEYDLMSGKGDLAPEDWAPMYQFMENFNRELAESGELVDTRALVAPVHTRRVRALENGVPVVTDGPYAETEEVLAGWWIVECNGFDRATEIAARLSACPSPGGRWADGYADVRPIAGGHDELDL